MRLFLAVIVGTVAHFVLSFAAGFVFTLVARTTGILFPTWFGMVISQLEVAGALAVAVLYSHRWSMAKA